MSIEARQKTRLILLLSFLVVPGIAHAQYQAHIDWEWGNFGPPVDPVCQTSDIMDNKGHARKRGATTPHEIVVLAIQASRAGDNVLANNWLAAGQCHNSGAFDAIRNGGAAAVNYAVTKFGSQVPGGPPPAATDDYEFTSGTGNIQAFVNITNGKTNQTRRETVDPQHNPESCATAALLASTQVCINAQISGRVIKFTKGQQASMTSSGGCVFKKV